MHAKRFNAYSSWWQQILSIAHFSNLSLIIAIKLRLEICLLCTLLKTTDFSIITALSEYIRNVNFLSKDSQMQKLATIISWWNNVTWHFIRRKQINTSAKKGCFQSPLFLCITQHHLKCILLHDQNSAD